MNSIWKITLTATVISILISLSIVAIYYTRVDSQIDSNCFTAAILDHRPFYGKNVNENIDQNFRIFINATILAKERDVDLIVFAESGLMTGIHDRKMALEYSIQIPNELTHLCENVEQIYDSSVSVLKRLSCLAMKYEIFLVAQLLDKQPCTRNITTECRDNYYIYNTAVLFDRVGQLVAKYHKMQPYGEMFLDPAQHDELIYIDTSLGRFGFQICFDIIYKKPGHILATEYDVDTIIFPTHWMDEAPFLSASQFQMAWAFGNNVSLLASNIHHPFQAGSLGSGIYNGGPERTFLNAHFTEDDAERLVIGRLPIHPRSTTRAKCNKYKDEIIEIPVAGREIITNGTYKYKQMNNTNVMMKALNIGQEEIELEHQGVKCHLKFEGNLSQSNQDGQYFLIGSNRSRANPSYEWGEEFCALVYCIENVDETCGKYSSNQLPLFYHVKLTATFDLKTVVYPSVLEYQNRLIPMDDVWTVSSKIQGTTKIHELVFGSLSFNSVGKLYRPLSTLSLYGRAYERDPIYKQKPAD
ncbi:Vascular non-inflammatory molecule 2 [Dermatophagoides farinae]|uniref:Vascular non-inflammatory molecule 2 n=1 Tax=Dermatophagoides farinae TaxID=6954 RepID=A0A922L2F4_DERFA|nr:Vascular non-inflammatory molecule 2 [Dermatophagoides farinae]